MAAAITNTKGNGGGNGLKQRKAGELSANQEQHLVMFAVGYAQSASHDSIVKCRAYLAANPDVVANMEALSERAVELVVSSSTTWVVQQESVKRDVADLKTALGYESANVVERLAIEQVALAWLRLHFQENHLSETTKGSHNKEIAHYWDRRVSMAQARYCQALIALAKIRKLKLPDITAIRTDVLHINAAGPVGVQSQALLSEG